MIVTVKAWLHAERDWRTGGTIFKLHCFEAPMSEESVVMREMTFNVQVDDSFDRKAIVEAKKANILRDQLERAKKTVEDLEKVLGGTQ